MVNQGPGEASWSEWQDLSFALFAIEIPYVFGANRDTCVLTLCTRSKAQK